MMMMSARFDAIALKEILEVEEEEEEEHGGGNTTNNSPLPCARHLQPLTITVRC